MARERRHTYLIKQGRHFSTLIPDPVFRNRTLHFHARFLNGCLYSPQQNPPQINKLFGISYGVHQWCSARIGWNSDGAAIRLFSYVYTRPEHFEFNDLGTVNLHEEHAFAIEREGEEVRISMDGRVPVRHQVANPKGWGFLLHPYFGGKLPAPHDMRIFVRWWPPS